VHPTGHGLYAHRFQNSRALPEKWEPVFGQEVRKIKRLEHLCDSDLSGNALMEYKTTMERLRKRVEFLQAARGVKWVTPGLILQCRHRRDDSASRIGFTVTKRVGNAVVRNRVKRRLREVARQDKAHIQTGFDYVVIGRKSTIPRTFSDLERDLSSAFRGVHRKVTR
jgi:ribonuclease P protein component